MRSASLWALARPRQDGPDKVLRAAAAAGFDLSQLKPRLLTRAAAAPGGPARASRTFDVLIVGGGSAGIAVASSLLQRGAWIGRWC